ncbi:MAG TPA: MarR family winged helix-turn-helix transcriptional regulator [Dissulfurispiraceae bacterium]|nr:MarR family winged helix-turn-helix transcriptional regulator [Dissulfurispiraceae bacterium]
MNRREATILAKSVAAECIAYRVRLLNRVITNIYDRTMKPLGLKVNQANILTMLSLADHASSADIARELLMDKSTVSRTVDRMRKNGWISVAGHGDGSSQVISVTPQGRKLMAAAHAQWKKAQKQAAALLGEEGVAAVRRLHDTVRTGKTKE